MTQESPDTAAAAGSHPSGLSQTTSTHTEAIANEQGKEQVTTGDDSAGKPGSDEDEEDDDDHYHLLLRGGASRIAGKGLFAARLIEGRALILSEGSLFTVDVNDVPYQAAFLDQARLLSEDQKRDLLHVRGHGSVGFPQSISTVQELNGAIKHNRPLATHYLIGTFWHSCYPFKKRQTMYKLFEWIPYLNHSCKPNAEASWDPQACRLNVRALKNIEKGKEVVISYVSPYMGWEDRHAELGFICRCNVCSLVERDEDNFHAREARLKALSEGTKVLWRYRCKWFGEVDFIEMEQQTEAAPAMAGDSESQAILTKAEELLVVANAERLWQNDLSILYEVQYLVHMAKSIATEDDEEWRLALEAKVLQFQLLVRCLGLRHPNAEHARLACQTLLEETDGGLEAFQKHVDELAEFDIDPTLIRARKRY